MRFARGLHRRSSIRDTRTRAFRRRRGPRRAARICVDTDRRARTRDPFRRETKRSPRRSPSPSAAFVAARAMEGPDEETAARSWSLAAERHHLHVEVDHALGHLGALLFAGWTRIP